MASQKLEKSKEQKEGQPSETAPAASVSAKTSKPQLISSKGSYQFVTPATTETLQLNKTSKQTTSDKVTSTGTELPTPKPVPSMTTTTMQSSMPTSTKTNETTVPTLPQNIPQNAPVATEIPTTPATSGLDTNAKPLKPALRVLPDQSLSPSLSTHLPPPQLPPQPPPVVPEQKSKSQLATAKTSVATLATTARLSP